MILPFNQVAAMGENPLTVNGWWLAAKSIRQNERAGDMLADNLSRQMANLDYLNLFSTIDLKYYFANKARRLKEYYKKQENHDLNPGRPGRRYPPGLLEPHAPPGAERRREPHAAGHPALAP